MAGLGQQELEKVGAMLSHDYGIQVHVGGDKCSTDGKVIHLPSLPTVVKNKRLLSMIRYFLDHEVGHVVAGSDLKLLEKAHKESPMLGDILNALEDVRSEKVMSDLYTGCSMNIEDGHEIILKKGDEDNATEKPGKDVQAPCEVYSVGKGAGHRPWVEDEVGNVVSKFEDRIKAVKDAKSTEEIYPLAEEIFKELGGEKQDEEDQDDSKAEDGGGEGDCEPKGVSDMLGDAIEGEAKAEKAQAKDDGTLTDPETGLAPAGDDRAFRLVHDTDEQLKAFNMGSHRQLQAAKEPLNVERFVSEAKQSGAAMRQRLMMLLQSEGKSAWRGGKKRGAPDPRRLAMLAAGLDDRVMRKKIESPAKRTACSLLVDASSSMCEANSAGGQSRYRSAMVAAMAFAQVVEAGGHKSTVGDFSNYAHALSPEAHRLLQEVEKDDPSVDPWKTRRGDGEPVPVDPNDESSLRRGAAWVVVRKPWHKRCADSAFNMAWSWSRDNCYGGTPMGEGMFLAGRDLMSQDADRRVMLVFCDGSPNDTLSVTKMCKALEKRGVEVVLIGIQIEEHKVRDLHDKYALVNNLSDLSGAVMTQLTKALKLTKHAA